MTFERKKEKKEILLFWMMNSPMAALPQSQTLQHSQKLVSLTHSCSVKYNSRRDLLLNSFFVSFYDAITQKSQAKV